MAQKTRFLTDRPAVIDGVADAPRGELAHAFAVVVDRLASPERRAAVQQLEAHLRHPEDM